MWAWMLPSEYWLSKSEGLRLCVTSTKWTPLLVLKFQCRSRGIVRIFNPSHDAVLGAMYGCNTRTNTLNLELLRPWAVVGIYPQHSWRVGNALDFRPASRTWNSVTAPVIIIVLVLKLYTYVTHSYKTESACCTSSPLGSRFPNISGESVRIV